MRPSTLVALTGSPQAQLEFDAAAVIALDSLSRKGDDAVGTYALTMAAVWAALALSHASPSVIVKDPSARCSGGTRLDSHFCRSSIC